MHESTRHRSRRRTWTKRRIAVIVSIAIIYGVWFNFIDTLAILYGICYNDNNICKSLGQIFGGEKSDLYYQPWNVIGHIIPGLFLLLYFWSKKGELAIIELFIAGILISTATMDSPLWGVIRLYGHHIPLWHCVPCEPPKKLQIEQTNDLWTWVAYYYNPVGSYGVWAGAIPSAALLFWSVVGRIAGAVVLILWQYRQEKNDKAKSSIKDLLSR